MAGFAGLLLFILLPVHVFCHFVFVFTFTVAVELLLNKIKKINKKTATTTKDTLRIDFLCNTVVTKG